MDKNYQPRHARRRTPALKTPKQLRRDKALLHQINSGIKPDARQTNQAFMDLINKVAEGLTIQDAQAATLSLDTEPVTA